MKNDCRILSKNNELRQTEGKDWNSRRSFKYCRIFSLCSIFIHYFVSSAVLLRQLDITENMLLAQLVIDICTSSRYYILEL